MQKFESFSFAFHPLSVSDVNQQVKNLLEVDPILEDVSVQGEVSNLSKPASGHMYFTLKDDKSALKCVMWRTSAFAFQPLLENGKLIIAHGRIGVYERDGIYQLYADALYPVGQGKLYEEFLRLKEQLEQEGLFAAERKKPLPDIPEKIGVVTSSSGAALQDILNTLSRRWPVAEVWLSHAMVQGAEAPASLLAAFNQLEKMRPDVILIGRGGGSLEDLWAFNNEALVRRIAASEIPVVSGIGHETDFTLVDFAADMRAPTPTGAAVAATPDRVDLMQLIDGFQLRMQDRLRSGLTNREEKLQSLVHRLEKAAPLRAIEHQQAALGQMRIRLNLWAAHTVERLGTEIKGIRLRLDSLNPENVLSRGYALIKDENGTILPSVKKLRAGKQVTIQLRDGSKPARIEQAER